MAYVNVSELMQITQLLGVSYGLDILLLIYKTSTYNAHGRCRDTLSYAREHSTRYNNNLAIGSMQKSSIQLSIC